MSVSDTVTIQSYPFEGRPAPGAPSGRWAVLSNVTGDATGGFISVSFQTGSVALMRTRYWQPVHLVALQDVSTTITYQVVFTGAWPPGKIIAPTGTGLVDTGSGVVSTFDSVLPKVMVGGPNQSASLTNAELCSIVYKTNTNTAIYRTGLLGYYWDVADIQAAGIAPIPV